MHRKRMQLTLFIDQQESSILESIRKRYNPEQFKLISAHVTVCREDELGSIEKIIQNLSALSHNPVTIHFGTITRFSEGKGLMIPAIGMNKSFEELRKKILQGITDNPRKHEPHITVMHPRNSTCTDEIFEAISQFSFPNKLAFTRISLIEQEDENPWKILNEFEWRS